ncbi:hypothetical protein M8C13_06985 [Crossiella sp. SN42]|uniref:hypothetical protein n=1 Tax=Crossiella sp. SN42 TaxID=2944808 RepID=UPI00207C8D0C|nr:hypothetical protein [Crossiella sp. SN42]MCO1575501.1 hypothetical protein [Crossiella sp. SN42]
MESTSRESATKETLALKDAAADLEKGLAGHLAALRHADGWPETAVAEVPRILDTCRAVAEKYEWIGPGREQGDEDPAVSLATVLVDIRGAVLAFIGSPEPGNRGKSTDVYWALDTALRQALEVCAKLRGKPIDRLRAQYLASFSLYAPKNVYG